VADLIADVVDAPHDEAVVRAVSERVDELTDEYTLYD
jgi:glycine hydroxymethyltransferase